MNMRSKSRLGSIAAAGLSALLLLGASNGAWAHPPGHGYSDHYDRGHHYDRGRHGGHHKNWKHHRREARFDNHRYGHRHVVVHEVRRPVVVERHVYTAPQTHHYPRPTAYVDDRHGSGLSGVVGAIAGGALGSTLGKGDGRLATTGAGAVLGYVVGDHVGRGRH